MYDRSDNCGELSIRHGGRRGAGLPEAARPLPVHAVAGRHPGPQGADGRQASPAQA